MIGADDRDLVVVGRRVVADGVVHLSLGDPAGSPLPDWSPGAHIDLVLSVDLVRQYSLCGRPGGSTWEIAVLRDENGRGGSVAVHDRLAVGACVRVRGPRNHFALVPAQRYVFVAGGIGITPLIPMIAAVTAQGTPWRLLYGGRTRRSMAFRDELVRTYGDLVTLVPQDEAGLLDLDGCLADAAGAMVYCCGPEPLLKAVEDRCAAAGLPLSVERFSPAENALAGPRAEFEVELARSGKVLRVPARSSVLEAVEDAGIFVASSCTEGTCGTCETRVLAGAIDHRDSVLDDAERERGDTMMICVSRAAGSRLVLDL